jgi:type IV secretory pathway VirB10-like protein
MGKFAWFLLGLILGAAIALAAVTLSGRRHAPPPEETPAPAVTVIPQVPPAETTLQPAPVPPAVVKPEPVAPPPAVESEAQIAEDAAAAGMTTRSRRAPTPPAGAPAESDQP